MLLEKYGPKSTGEVVGNSVQLKAMAGWLRAWKKGASLILCGPPGCGKSISVRLLAKELGYDVVEMNETKDILAASAQGSVFLRKKLILLEDAHLIRPRQLVAKLIENSPHPAVIISQSPYDIGMPAVVKSSRIIKFARIDDRSTERFLSYVCRKEGIRCSDATMKSIAKASNGDMRAALLDLQAMSYGARDSSYTIFELLKAVFTGDRASAKKMLESYQSFDEVFFWMCENIHREYRSNEDVANAYDSLSRADLFRARILKRQSWGLQKYFVDMFIYGVSAKRRASIAAYAPPRRLQKIDDALLEKIGRHLHVSRRTAIQYIPVIKNFAGDEEFCTALGFDENDMEALRAVNKD